MNDSPVNLLLRAATFAAEKHKTQKRKNTAETPYINHPLEAANLLATKAGVASIERILESTGESPALLVVDPLQSLAAGALPLAEDVAAQTRELKMFAVRHHLPDGGKVCGSRSSGNSEPGDALVAG